MRSATGGLRSGDPSDRFEVADMYEASLNIVLLKENPYTPSFSKPSDASSDSYFPSSDPFFRVLAERSSKGMSEPKSVSALYFRVLAEDIQRCLSIQGPSRRPYCTCGFRPW